MGKKQKKVAAKKDQEVDDESFSSEVAVKEEDVKVEPTEPEEMAHEDEHQRTKSARLIVRNISFKATEDKVKKHFSSFGDLTDIQLLRKPDGRLVGCCFVEYSKKTSAAKAIAHLSGKPFLNRPIVIDWAVPKKRFIEKTQKAEDSEESGFHEDEDDKSKVLPIKQEGSDDEDDENESDRDMSDDDDAGSNSGTEEDDVEDVEASENEDESDEDESNKLERRKPLRESHDISEGCTVFVKNIPFSVDNQEFKKCMQKFGPIYYALICIDPLTEHSKGTGFVKFKTKDVADACLAAGRDGEIVLRSSALETQPALSREDLQKGSKKKSDVKKDGRNLYLIKEGVILAGSPAASGVSQADMAKRLQLEQWKTQMLRNLNKFVSRNRLVLQNLPSSYDDQKLRALCLKYGGNETVITEARVMRDLRNVDSSGRGKSKEYGFVTFTRHENALQALRGLNNNPDIFTPAKRPIVAFSIEDKKALNIRHKRLEKSRAALSSGHSNFSSQKAWEKQQRENKLQNKKPQSGYREQNKGSVSGNSSSEAGPSSNVEKKLTKKEARKLKKKKLVEQRNELKASNLTTTDNSSQPKFMGESAKHGQSGIMSRQKLREQAELQVKTLKSKSRKERMKKQLAAIKIKQPKQKMAQPKDLRKEDNFSKLVNKYKSQLASSENERKRWYDQ